MTDSGFIPENEGGSSNASYEGVNISTSEHEESVKDRSIDLTSSSPPFMGLNQRSAPISYTESTSSGKEKDKKASTSDSYYYTSQSHPPQQVPPPVSESGDDSKTGELVEKSEYTYYSDDDTNQNQQIQQDSYSYYSEEESKKLQSNHEKNEVPEIRNKIDSQSSKKQSPNIQKPSKKPEKSRKSTSSSSSSESTSSNSSEKAQNEEPIVEHNVAVEESDHTKMTYEDESFEEDPSDTETSSSLKSNNEIEKSKPQGGKFNKIDLSSIIKAKALNEFKEKQEDGTYQKSKAKVPKAIIDPKFMYASDSSDDEEAAARRNNNRNKKSKFIKVLSSSDDELFAHHDKSASKKFGRSGGKFRRGGRHSVKNPYADDKDRVVDYEKKLGEHHFLDNEIDDDLYQKKKSKKQAFMDRLEKARKAPEVMDLSDLHSRTEETILKKQREETNSSKSHSTSESKSKSKQKAKSKANFDSDDDSDDKVKERKISKFLKEDSEYSSEGEDLLKSNSEKQKEKQIIQPKSKYLRDDENSTVSHDPFSEYKVKKHSPKCRRVVSPKREDSESKSDSSSDSSNDDTSLGMSWHRQFTAIQQKSPKIDFTPESRRRKIVRPVEAQEEDEIEHTPSAHDSPPEILEQEAVEQEVVENKPTTPKKHRKRVKKSGKKDKGEGDEEGSKTRKQREQENYQKMLMERAREEARRRRAAQEKQKYKAENPLTLKPSKFLKDADEDSEERERRRFQKLVQSYQLDPKPSPVKIKRVKVVKAKNHSSQKSASVASNPYTTSKPSVQTESS